MTEFNFDVVAELFPTRNDVALFRTKARRVGRPPIGYGRFARASYAIRFAIEELPAELLSDTCLKVDNRVIDAAEIRRLYESKDYPLIRRASPLKAANIRYLSPQ